MNPVSALFFSACTALLATFCAWTEDKPENKLSAEVKAVLEKPERFELLSLDPAVEQAKGKEGFHGWKVLGKTTVKDSDVRKEIVTALDKGIADSNARGAKCFDPRHGIRVQRDGKTVDLVICFECGWVYVFAGDKEDRQGVAVTTDKPQAVFDKVLKAADVPLPKQGKR
jgi:hypothetical protein